MVGLQGGLGCWGKLGVLEENGCLLGNKGGPNELKRLRSFEKVTIDNQLITNLEKDDFVVFFENTKGCEGQAPLPTKNFAINRY